MIEMPTAYIALGSNLGDRLASLRRAVMLLKDRDGILVDSGVDLASLFETEPMGGPAGQAKYLNSAIRLRTRLEPLQLMEALLEIERALGRKREVPWESRAFQLSSFSVTGADSIRRFRLESEAPAPRNRELKGPAWESRIIDLDLLLYDHCVCNTPSLTLPHPRLHERRFVLEPLAEIAGDVVHPTIRRRISDIAADMQTATDQVVTKIMGAEWHFL